MSFAFWKLTRFTFGSPVTVSGDAALGYLHHYTFRESAAAVIDLRTRRKLNSQLALLKTRFR